MSAYFRVLNAAVDEERARQLNQKNADLKSARARLTRLEDRLTRLLATIPVELQRQGLSLPALQVALRGRWRGNCHPGELGSALKKLGFVRARRWSNGEPSGTVWLPRDQREQNSDQDNL